MNLYPLRPAFAPILLARIANGDETAVQECIDTYGNLIWSLARKFTARADDAEDAVQEVFMEIWQNAGRYDSSKSAEITFISMLARRRLIDRLRKTYRQPNVQSIDEYIESSPNVFEHYNPRSARRTVKGSADLRPISARDVLDLRSCRTRDSRGESMPLGRSKRISAGVDKSRRRVTRRPRIAAAAA